MAAKPPTCERCDRDGPLCDKRCHACTENRYREVQHAHGKALSDSGGRLGNVLKLQASPAYQARVAEMIRIRAFLGIPEVSGA